MRKLTEKEMEEAGKMVKAEFSDDPILQQVHCKELHDVEVFR